MCGIFGFMLKKPLSINKVVKVLQKLEANKNPDEKTAVGGYGAGIAVLLDDGGVFSEKVGKNAESPVCQLAEVIKPQLKEAKTLISHVRHPSGEFMDTVSFKEAAQPYVENFEPELTIISAHNGRVENYRELKAKLKGHAFESEKTRVIDSEVIPHYFGSLLNEADDANQAASELLNALKGKTVGSIALLQLDEEEQLLHLLHKGWSRGLTIWTNENGEVIFCTRPGPVHEEIGDLISRGCFREKVVVKPREEIEFKKSFPIPT